MKYLASAETFHKFEEKLDRNTFFSEEELEIEIIFDHLYIVHFENSINDSKDSFTVYLKASVFNVPKKKDGFKSPIPFAIHGFWTLSSLGEDWQLSQITSVQRWRKFVKKEVFYETTFKL